MCIQRQLIGPLIRVLEHVLYDRRALFFGLLGRIVGPLGLVREAKVKVKVNSRTVFTRTVKIGIKTKTYRCRFEL